MNGLKRKKRPNLSTYLFAKLMKVFAVILIALVGSPVFAQGLVDEKDALEGLEGAYIMGGDVDDVLAVSGLQKEDVLSIVTSRLTNTGFRVFDETEWLMLDDSPVLHIDLTSAMSDEEHTLYSVRLEILYLVNPISRRNFKTYAVVWSEGKFGVLGSSGSLAILHAIELLVDRLVSDYNAVNS